MVSIIAMEPYKQKCQLSDCTHVLIKVGQPAVQFTLCKARIMHESNFFRAAFQDDQFKEGDQYVVELREEDAVQFKLFVTTMFPDNNDSYTPLISEDLTNLLRCADQYDAYGSAAVMLTIVLSIKTICQEYDAYLAGAERGVACFLSKHRTYVKDALVAASKYNLDRNHFVVLTKYAASIDDIYKLEGEVKPEILMPIVFSQMQYLQVRGKTAELAYHKPAFAFAFK